MRPIENNIFAAVFFLVSIPCVLLIGKNAAKMITEFNVSKIEI